MPNAKGGDSEDRRSDGRLSKEELEAIAKRAAAIVWDQFTLLVGRSTIRLALYVVGALVLAGIAYLGGKGLLK